jgi:hypothetical protein
MGRIALIALIALAVGCTDGAGGADAGAHATAVTTAPKLANELHLGAEAHAGIKMTPQIRACRAACWQDIPFNACAVQRDKCYETAANNADKRHCRHMSHTCRKTRRTCLQGCWGDGQPLSDPPDETGAEAE